MEYGLIGEKLAHSFSKEIHGYIGDYSYELCEIPKEKLHDFLTEKRFKAMNVTIPYKQAVLPYLSEISPEAQKIGAVNLIVNKNGRLYGYNTDYFGAKQLIERANVQVKGKKALILGSGGTRRTLHTVLSDLGAGEILTVSREKTPDTITYEEAKTLHKNAEILVNTTPVGMYPNTDAIPIDPCIFPTLSGAIDVIYNPLCTDFIEKARKCGVPCANGLFMLAAQAVQASAIMRDISLSEEKTKEICEETYKKTLRAKQNIVLIGMPTSGKSSIGALLAKKTGRVLYDTDALTAAREQKSVPEIFALGGETAFRAAESQTVRELAGQTGCIIATGGGTILSAENVRLLKKNGKLFFLDRPLSLLSACDDRPLSSRRSELEKMYEKRLPLYLAAADERISNDGKAEVAADKILEKL